MNISEINIFPVKSLGGISLNKAIVEDRGLAFDRRWMLVDDANRFLTQREVPNMAAVSVKLGADAFTARADDVEDLIVPFQAESESTATVAIWSSKVKAKIYPNEINKWFSEVLSIKCRLARMPEETKRTVEPWYAVRKYVDTVSFADGYPFLLISEASLDDLNSRLEIPIPMNRFRPNFVVNGAEPFAEDGWKRIRIGETIFHVVKPCARCVITAVDQSTGIPTGKEPLKTLAKFRTENGKVMFGQNLIAEKAGAVIKVGEQVEVLETRNRGSAA